MTLIPWGEYLPDLPAFANPGATTITNVIPHAASYKPLKGLSAYSPALDARCRGAVSVNDKDGNTYTFAGNATKLYQLSASAATDRSKSGGYSLAADSFWEFAQFGNDLVAVTIDSDPQSITLGGAAFANLGGSPPKARHICTVGKQDAFLVLGNVIDSVDGAVPNRVVWSAAGDATSWTAGTNQSSEQDLNGDGGWVQRVIGGEYLIVFQERSIWRADYVGGALIFNFTEVEPARGTPAPASVAQFGSLIFYLSNDGFYAFDGARSSPIGSNKVDKTFYAEVDQTFLNRVSATVDPINKLVIWAYTTGETSGDGNPDKLLIFDIVNNRWARASVNCQLLFRSLSDGYTLDELDAIGTLDALPFSLDSRAWTGGSISLAAFDTDSKWALFTGDTLAATLETAELEANPGGMAHCQAVRPYVDAASPTVQVGTRDTPQASVSWSSASSLNDIGEADFRSEARYHRFRLNIPAGASWSHAQGLDPRLVARGRR